jgi:hypothetical protein
MQELFNFAERAKANQALLNVNSTDLFTPAFNFAENYKHKVSIVSYEKDQAREAHNKEMQMSQTIDVVDQILPH